MVSAEHGDGMGDLYDALAPFEASPQSAEEKVEGPSDKVRTLRLAIVGRPNVGKSTMINRLVGEERTITGPEPGLTRDAIAIKWAFKGRPIELVDTETREQ